MREGGLEEMMIYDIEDLQDSNHGITRRKGAKICPKGDIIKDSDLDVNWIEFMLTLASNEHTIPHSSIDTGTPPV